MATQATRVILGFVLLFGFCARAATYKSPLLDHHAWRQADTASISRNFYRERFNVLYPQVDERGAQPVGYVETGLELFAFLVAALAQITGFHFEIGRLLSALLFVCSDLLAWTVVKRRFGRRAGLVAAFLYAFGFPLLIFIERAFMNEALLICLSLVCLVAAQNYLSSGKASSVAVLVVSSAVIGAIKLPYLIIWAPIVGLFVEVDGMRAWRRMPLWLMMAVDLAAAAAWYWHAHQLALSTGLTFGLTNKLFDADVVFSGSFVWTIATRLFKDVLGPIGCVGACAGLWFGVRERRWPEILGVAGFVAYLLLVAVGNDVHDYYQLAIIPIAPSLVAFGLVRLVDSFAVRRRRLAILSIATGLAALATFARSVSAHSWYEYSESEVEDCRQVASLTSPTDRIVMVGTADPHFLFCVDRKGWLLSGSDADEAHIRQAWKDGARVATVPASFDDEAVRRFLADNGTVIPTSGALEIVKLR